MKRGTAAVAAVAVALLAGCSSGAGSGAGQQPSTVDGQAVHDWGVRNGHDLELLAGFAADIAQNPDSCMGYAASLPRLRPLPAIPDPALDAELDRAVEALTAAARKCDAETARTVEGDLRIIADRVS